MSKEQEENGTQETQRLVRESTKSRASGPLGPVVNPEDDDSPQPGTEDVPDGA